MKTTTEVETKKDGTKIYRVITEANEADVIEVDAQHIMRFAYPESGTGRILTRGVVNPQFVEGAYRSGYGYNSLLEGIEVERGLVTGTSTFKRYDLTKIRPIKSPNK